MMRDPGEKTVGSGGVTGGETVRMLRKGLAAASSRYVVVSAALALAAALSVVPAQAASAASTSVKIVVPSSGAVLSGTQGFDAVPNGSGDTGVQFVLGNGPGAGPCIVGSGPGQSGCLIGNATLTWVGWLVQFNTENVPNGSYLLSAIVSPSNAEAVVQVTVSNPPPTVVLPSSGAKVSGVQYLDCVPPPGVNQVQFWLTGGNILPALGQLVSNGVRTLYGWLGTWSTSGVANGSYSLYCSGTYPQPDAGIGQGPSIPVVVSN